MIVTTAPNDHNVWLLSKTVSCSAWRNLSVVGERIKVGNGKSHSQLLFFHKIGRCFSEHTNFPFKFSILALFAKYHNWKLVSFLLLLLLLLQSHGKYHIKSFYHSLLSSIQSRVEKPLLVSYWYSSSPLDAITPAGSALIGFRSSLCLKSSRRSWHKPLGCLAPSQSA